MRRYMIIPVYDTIVLPDVEYQLGCENFSDAERSRAKIDGDRAILLPIKEEKTKDKVSLDDFYGLGVLAEIKEIAEIPGGVRLHVQTREKVRVEDMDVIDGMLEGSFSVREEVADISYAGERDCLEKLKKTTLDISRHIQGGHIAAGFLKSCATVGEYASLFCQFFGMSPDEKYELLETDSMRERCNLVQEALMRFQGAIELQVDMNRRFDATEGNAYKKAAIRKQIGMLEAELNDLEPEEGSEENDYKARIQKAHMPEEAEKEALRMLKRYSEAQPNDPERNMMENWLDFVTALAWQVGEKKPIDLTRARKILDRDHYGLEKVKDRIIEQLAVMTLKKEDGGSILLLVGAPGTGKTSLGKSIAEALGREYVRISLGGIRDEAEIRGHRRTYIGAMPGRIMEGIKRAGTMNPVVVLDEVDKMSVGYNGDPSSALLEVLDPEQNNNFTDHYMNVPYDLSNAFFICTANTTDTIPSPLLDRMEMIRLPGYTPIEKFHIGKEHLLPKSRTDNGLAKKQLSVTDGAIRKMIENYTMEAGVRGLKKQLDALCRAAASRIVSEDLETLRVREKDLKELLGNPKISHDDALKKMQAGVATGLAWTSAGGEILFIETTVMPGKGNIIITGQLGEVMKESAQISVSLLKSLFVSESLDFSDKDIHIHVPQGAVPKDGPSAGVTLFTALTSLLTGRTVSPKLAMTGEISLRGSVLPIGGLPEKLMAAQRAGIEKVLIPSENVRDLDDVAAEVREALTIVPVRTVREVIREALDISLPEGKASLFSKGYEDFAKERRSPAGAR